LVYQPTSFVTSYAITLRSTGFRQAGSVLRIVGLILLIFSATMLVPVMVSLLAHEPSAAEFIEAALVTAVSGLVLWLAFRQHDYELQSRDGFLLVSLTWGLLPIFAALPLILFIPEMSLTDGFFEASSGLTTTGATVLAGLDRLPISINLWRAQLQWMGGMGLIVLAVAILPLLGVGGRQIFYAETPGAFKDSRLTPRIEDTARGLWYIYLGITVACIAAYWTGGMSLSDAVIHGFTTLSLGGFSSHDASFGHFDSPALEAVAMVFMLIAGVNFSTHFLAWSGKGMSPYRADAEAGWFLAVTLISALAIAVMLALYHTYPSLGTALRYSLFNVISIATTTGYANADFALWPIFAPGLMLILCLFASSAGSTGGGVKMIRIKLAVLQLRREFLRLCHPRAIVPVRIGVQVVPPAIIVSVLTFLAAYAAIMVLLTMLLMVSGLSLVTAASAVIACISNTGPGLNEIGPSTTYAVLTDFQTWVCSIAMLIGRLELFTVMVIFTRDYWRR
jgi:trk system potassium uptake protein TrkH